MLGQMAAMNMQMFARAFLVFSLTGSYSALGVMALANAAPMMFFSLFGGVIAERTALARQARIPVVLVYI